MIPVDGKACSTEVGTAGEAEPPALRHLAMALVPATSLYHRLDAFAEAHRTDLQPVRGDAIWLDQLLHSKSSGIDAQLMGDLVEVHLEGESGLWSSMAPLGATGSLIGEGTDALEAILRQIVSDRL